MNKSYFNFAIIFVIGILIFSFGFYFTGNVVYEDPSMGGVPDEEIECMENCISQYCTIGDVECAEPYTPDCMDVCNAVRPEQTEEETCVQDCLYSHCDEFDWDCQDLVINDCDVECGLAGDAPEWDTLSEEEQCISVCVAEIDPSIICGSSSEGETGNEVCQRCAAECVYLYEGPCLNDEEITDKEGECETCEHCYGSPVIGDSGEGYECIVDIECLDASGEFGDESGVESEDESEVEDDQEESVTPVFEGIVNFFKRLFG